MSPTIKLKIHMCPISAMQVSITFVLIRPRLFHLCLSFRVFKACTCIDDIITDIYGGSGGWPTIDINQGRINRIVSWQVSSRPGLASVQWESDEQTAFGSVYGWNSGSECGEYILDSEDYINGYRVLYSGLVESITLYTKSGRTFQCEISSLSSSYQDTGNVIFPNHYLTGFYVRWGTIIDSIGFQFTAINTTNKCATFDNPCVTANPCGMCHIYQGLCTYVF